MTDDRPERQGGASADEYERQRAASAVEYGLLIAGIALVIVAAYFLFADAVVGLFTDSCSKITTETTGTTATCA